MLKLLSTAALAAVAFADEPVGTVIGIDLGTTYSVRAAATTVSACVAASKQPLLPTATQLMRVVGVRSASVCTSMDASRSSLTTRATASRRLSSPSPTASASSARPRRTRLR